VLIVLAAGFIGQFGKRLADYLVARSHRKRDSEQAAQASIDREAIQGPGDWGVPHEPTGWEVPPPATSKKAAKAAKKAAKAEAKKIKKAGS
jgi:hypothetical protein